MCREVKTLTANREVAEELSRERIDLEVMALSMVADDPEQREQTAASAVEAVSKLLSLHAQMLLDSHPDATK